MSDTQTTETTAVEQAAESASDSMNFKAMREKMQRLEEENAKLAGVARVAAFKEAGIDVNSGIGKAIYRLYDGDIEPASIASFATEEFDWQPPKAEAVTPAHTRVDTIMGVGEAPSPGDAAAKIAEAEKAGDWVTSQALKDAELRRIAQEKFGY